MKREEKKKKYAFAVGTAKRIYFMYPDTQPEQESWMKILSAVIDRLKSPPKKEEPTPAPEPTPEPTPQPQPVDPEPVVNEPEDDLDDDANPAMDTGMIPLPIQTKA